MTRLNIARAAILVASVLWAGEAMAGSIACKDKLACQALQKGCTSQAPADTDGHKAGAHKAGENKAGANRAGAKKGCALAPKKRAQKSAPQPARQTPAEPEISEEEEEEDGER